MRRWTGALAASALVLCVAPAFGADANPPSSVSERNPAQPAPRVAPIRNHDPCFVDQAIAIDEKGLVLQCGAWVDGHVLRWTL